MPTGHYRRACEPLEQRFYRKIQKTETCWLWRGAITAKGYGSIRYRETHLQAHRASYMLTYGEIPDGKHVLHKCDNRRCVNPKHLFLGTNIINHRDRVSKLRRIVLKETN